MYTFKKEERLCNKKLIDGLFHNGSSFLCYPYKVSWQLATAGVMPAQIVFSVGKKRFKRAVIRNLIKRRLREAYRLHKQQYLYDYLTAQGKSIVLSVGYVGKQVETYAFIETKMIKMLTQLNEQLAKQ